MKLVVATQDDQIVNVEVDPGTEVENLKAILQAETDIPTDDQVLMASGKIIQSGTLSGNGVGDNDVVMLMRKPPGAGAGAGTGAGAVSGASNPTAVDPSDGSAVNPVEYIRYLKGDPAQLAQIARVLPELHSAVMSDNQAEFQKILRALHQSKLKEEARRKAEIDLLNADPFDMEAQAKIQAMIDQSNVNENYEQAMENTPEAFGSVIMLYVDMEVNGHPLKAFVDSGAQMTIMSLGCAQRLGLERLIDSRWQGVAKGVGTQKIIGRVHQAPIKVGNKHLACAITVLEKEQDMDFLLGLDMLKRHQCCIDLEKNELRIGSAEVALPFLGEADLPASARPQNFEEQPATPAPAADSDDDADGAVTITEATKQKLQAIADEDSSGGDSADPSAAMAVSKEKQLDDAFNTLERSMTQSVYFLPDGTAEWELLPWDVKVDDVVGEGAFGEIRCGRWRGSPVAIKTLKSDCMTDAIALKEFNCEMSIWCRLVHPNIVQFLGVGYKAGQPPIMVCELMGGGSLQQKLLELQSWGKKMDFDRAFKIASNIAAALNYMHSRRPYAVIHRDIKPANILLTGNGVAKVADFGLSKMFDITTPREPARDDEDVRLSPSFLPTTEKKSAEYVEKVYSQLYNHAFLMTGETGAYKYMAPEVFKHEFYGLKCDVYSYAMVVYELFEGLLAFGDPITWAHRAASSDKARPGWNFMAAYESRRCEEMCKLVEQCWHSDPKERPTFMRVANVLRSIGYISKFEKKAALVKGKKGGAGGAGDQPGCNCVVM